MLKRLIFVVVFAGHVPAHANDGWTVETVAGKPDLAAAWASPDGKLVVAAGGGGTVYRRTDAAWTADKTTALVDFLDVSGSGANDVWVTGAAGGTVHWDGAAWTSVMSESTGAYVAIAALAPAAACAVGKRVSTWNGDVWRSVKDRPKINGLAAVAALVGGKKPVFVAVGSGGQVWRVTGTGQNAVARDDKPVTTGDLAGVAACPVKGGDIVAVGAVAVVNRGGTANGKWSVLTAPPVAVRGAVAKCKGKKVTHVAAIAAAGDEVLVLDVAKGAWTRETVQAGAVLTDIAAFGAGLIVSGKAGLIATRTSWP